MLAAFADCGELRTFTSGRSTAFSSFGQILVLLPKGQFTTLNGLTRSQFVAKFRTANVDTSAAFRKAADALKAKTGIDAQPTSLGVVKIDDNAAYLGLITGIPNAAEGLDRATSIVAMTSARDLPISINIYRRGVGDNVLAQVLSSSQDTLARFAKANP